MTSIQRRLLVWLLLALALMGVIVGSVTYVHARLRLHALSDEGLEQVALSLPDPLIIGPTSRPANPPHHDNARALDAFVLQVWNQRGDLIYKSHRDVTLPLFHQPGLSTVMWQGHPWRVYVRLTGGSSIEVAQSIHARTRLAVDNALHMLAPLLVAMPFMALLIGLAIRHGLRPLVQVAADLGRRSPEALDPVPDHDSPVELKPLVGALNDLLVRLRRVLEAQRAFIADAAHGLRTPLATLQIQTRVVARTVGDHPEAAPAVSELKIGLEQATRLVQQLLTLSRLEPDAPARPLARVNLGELAKQVLIQHVPLARSKKIDLGMANNVHAEVMGNPDQLSTLIGNLIDNAIRYTPFGGRIDVGLRKEGEDVILEVDDSGPGIPPEDRQRVFERFYRRLGHTEPGSGLGLAIVRQIAGRHRAIVWLSSAEVLGGLKVTVRFAHARGPI